MRIGELFAGYGGLGLGVKAALGGEVAWVSDIDPGANRILEHRLPGVPNLGDISAVDWSQVEPVDVLTGGFPCQDVSAAGKRAGIRPGTRSGLWSMFAYAISQLRPSLVVIENVRGLLSAQAHSDVEPCPWCVGDGPDGSLRALGAVLGDLASLGYDASWHGLRATDVGACHGRFRVFIVAYPGRSDWGRADTGRRGLGWPDGAPAGWVEGATSPVGGSLLPTPRATDGTNGGPNQRGSSGDLMLPSAILQATALLPTPAVNDMGEGKTPDVWDEWTAKMQAEHGNGNGHGKSFAIEAQRLLPTPRTANNENRQSVGYGGTDGNFHGLLTGQSSWGDYAPAIARWEHVLGRAAPAPTETGPKGSPRLSPIFVEWMMGLPAGWVTDVPGLNRNAMLKALGNGVVPQQAEAALRLLLPMVAAA